MCERAIGAMCIYVSDIWIELNILMETLSLCTQRNGPIIIHPNRSNSVNQNEACTFPTHYKWSKLPR